MFIVFSVISTKSIPNVFLCYSVDFPDCYLLSTLDSDIFIPFCSALSHSRNGERAEVSPHLLRRQMPQAYESQGHAVQEGQGVDLRSRYRISPSTVRHVLMYRSSSLRRETTGLRWPDEADLPEEGEDYEEDRECSPPLPLSQLPLIYPPPGAAHGVHRVQASQAVAHQALQALRVGRTEESPWSSDPVLIRLLMCPIC